MDSPSPENPSGTESPNPKSPQTTGTRLSHRPASRQKPDLDSNTRSAPIPDDEHGADLPITMSASVVLSSLPRDAHRALVDAEAVDTGKGE